MSDKIQIQCGPADRDGKRAVIASLGNRQRVDKFDVASAFHRSRFCQSVIERFSLTEDAAEWLDAEILKAATSESAPLYSPSVVCMADVAPLPVDWAWPDRIARGALSIIDGEMGDGKSSVTVDLTGRATRGDAMPPLVAPDGTYTPANVVFLSPEDDPARTIRPRLDATRADVSRVFLMQAMNYIDDGEERAVQLPLDVEPIRQVVRDKKASWLFIDPFTAHLDAKTNTNSDSDVRRALMPLAKMAQQEQLAVVLVRHFSKKQGQSALNRGLGSVGIIATCRAGFVIARDPENPEQFVMACSKMNLGRKPPSLGFSIVEAGDSSRIQWAGTVDVSADDLVATKGERQGGTKLQAAKELIHELLGEGGRGSNEVEGAMTAAGISRSTYWTARKDIGVKAQKTDFEGNWLLSLPSVNGHGSNGF